MNRNRSTSGSGNGDAVGESKKPGKAGDCAVM